MLPQKKQKTIVKICVTALFSVIFVITTSAKSFAAGSEKIILLHHSTGGNLYNEGHVASWFDNYNQNNGTNYSITERAYPTSPYPWNNYPYDWWNLWVTEDENGNPRTPACDSSNPNIECLNTLTQNYDVIIFKQCFPGADVLADTGTPDVSSNRKSLENYKEQYRALRREFDKYPDTLFIAWTLVPRHRLATNAENAARAKQFVDWVKNDWLTEDGKSHPNIKIFDFWGIVAESNSNPQNGQVNTLKYEYERSHTGSDSHPNTLANQTAGPLFGQSVIDSIQEFEQESSGPTVNGVSGNVVDGNVITVSGNGFGMHGDNNERNYTYKGNTPINTLFKDFEDGLIESQNVTVENGYTDEWSIGHETTDNRGYYAIRNYVATRLATLAYTQSTASNGWLYATFYMRVNGGIVSSGKPFRWYFGDLSNSDNMYIGLFGTNFNASANGSYTSHSEASNSTGDYYSFIPGAEGNWNRVTVEAHYISPGVGTFKFFVNGALQEDSHGNSIQTDYFENTTSFTPNGHTINWGYIDNDNGNDDLSWDYDDLYVDYTQARVELCNISQWDINTPKHCEIQIPTAWTNNSINIALNQGSFNDGDTAYLYVVDENGNVNENGYPITIEGNNPPAPTTYNLSNFTSLVTNWLNIGDSNSDVNNDGIVNTRDLGIMMSNWSE